MGAVATTAVDGDAKSDTTETLPSMLLLLCGPDATCWGGSSCGPASVAQRIKHGTVLRMTRTRRYTNRSKRLRPAPVKDPSSTCAEPGASVVSFSAVFTPDDVAAALLLGPQSAPGASVPDGTVKDVIPPVAIVLDRLFVLSAAAAPAAVWNNGCSGTLPSPPLECSTKQREVVMLARSRAAVSGVTCTVSQLSELSSSPDAGVV